MADEPKYDLETGTWTGHCPCISAMQVDPDCPHHGNLQEEKDDRPEEARGTVIQTRGKVIGSVPINSHGRLIR